MTAALRPPALGWREAATAAAGQVRRRPALIAVGLLGFLARGGLVAFLLPIVALPTPTGISNFMGGTALTGAGASDGLIRLIVVGVLLVLALVVAGALLGAVADVLLAREGLALTLARDRGFITASARAAIEGETRLAIPLTSSLVARVFLIRTATLVPVALAVAWATSRLVVAGYHQLILPDDVSVPLAIRILGEALDAAVIVVGVWLVSEFFGGRIARLVIVGGRPVPTAIGVAVLGLLRRPLTSVATYAAGVVALIGTAGPTIVAAALLWSRLQALLADQAPVIVLLPATFVFVLVWGGGMLVTGAAVAWRSMFATVDILRSHRVVAMSQSGSAMSAFGRTISAGGRALEDR